MSEWIKQKKKICEVDYKSFETIQSEENKGKWKRVQKAYMNYRKLLREAI